MFKEKIDGFGAFTNIIQNNNIIISPIINSYLRSIFSKYTINYLIVFFIIL